MLKLFICIIGVFLFTCQNQNDEISEQSGKYTSAEDGYREVAEESIEMSPPRTAESPPMPPVINEVPKETFDKGSKIIKNGSMFFEVDNLEKVKISIDTILSNFKGYYENEQYNAYGTRISYHLVLRVPSKDFERIVSLLENGIGRLTSKSISSNDVTEEYVDLNIRLENNLAYLAQYKEILRTAKSVKDILEVQEKIRQIEEEIESKKGRLKFLEDKVQYSTLNIEIAEIVSKDLTRTTNFGKRVVNAFNGGIQGFLDFSIFLIRLWPFILIFILLFALRRKIIGFIRRKK